MRVSSFSGSTRSENSCEPYTGKFLMDGGSIEMVRPGFFVFFLNASRANRMVSSSRTATKRTLFGMPVVLSGCRILKNSLALFATVLGVIFPFLLKLNSSFINGEFVADCSDVVSSCSFLMSSSLISSYFFFSFRHCLGSPRESIKPGATIIS